MPIFYWVAFVIRTSQSFFFKKRRHSACSLLLTYPFIKLLVSNGDLLELDEKACDKFDEKACDEFDKSSSNC